jgi:hypothetical protein
MSDSPLLTLPYLAAAQAQKHVTHNEALSMLDGLVHLAVLSRVLATPPASPLDGDRYLIPAGATGGWSNHVGQIALRMEGAWRYVVPREGWRMWVSNEDALLTFDGTIWIAASVPGSLQNLSLLGVNATADPTNKLTVASQAALFNNVGSGVQVKLNKNAVSDSASFLFQTGFSGRAEIGTTGDDSFHIKVSSNGSAFNESLIIANASGLVTFKNGTVFDPVATDPASPSNGQVWYNSTTGKFRARQNGANVDVIGGGGGTPGGTSGQLQVNNAGTFAGVTLGGDASVNTGTGALTIETGAVTLGKMATLAPNSIVGNNTGAAATPIALTAAQVKALLAISTADVAGLGALATAGSINLATQATGLLPTTSLPFFGGAGDIVSSNGSNELGIKTGAVTLDKMVTMGAARLIGNNTAGIAAPQHLTATQVTAMLDGFTTALKGLVPASGGGTSNFLRADGTWAAPASGGGGSSLDYLAISQGAEL